MDIIFIKKREKEKMKNYIINYNLMYFYPNLFVL